jgi:hypothetical protein
MKFKITVEHSIVVDYDLHDDPEFKYWDEFIADTVSDMLITISDLDPEDVVYYTESLEPL